VGGAIAGGTMGVLAAPVALTSLTGTAIVVSTAGVGEVAAAGATAGVLGGVGERAFENNGNIDAAVGTPEQILVDAGVGAASGLLGRGAGSMVPKATGAEGAAENAAQAAAKHPALSKSALARRTASAAAVASAKAGTQEKVGEAGGHSLAEALGKALKPDDKPEPEE